MKTLKWETIGKLTVIISVILLTFLSYNLMTTEKHVVEYSIANKYDDGGMFLRVDIENYPDDYIPLIGVSYMEAAALVDSLNKTVPKRQ